MAFKENLKTELEFRGKKVKELAFETGISRRTIDQYLSTAAKMPSAENAVKIAQALHTTVEYLVTGKDPSSEATTPQLSDTQISIYKQNAKLIEKIAPLSDSCKHVIEELTEFLK